MLKKIWSDSVWSKVIASAIIGIAIIIYSKIESITNNISFSESFGKIVDIKVSIVYVIGFLLTFLIINSVVKKLYPKNKSHYNKKQLKLKEFNRIRDDEQGLLYKWRVYFKSNGEPAIIDATGFCTKHSDAPIKLINGNCPMRDCENSRIHLDEYRTENHIESLVLNEWDKINK